MTLPGDARASAAPAAPAPGSSARGQEPPRARARAALRRAPHRPCRHGRLRAGAEPRPRVRGRARAPRPARLRAAGHARRAAPRRSPPDPLSGPPDNWRDVVADPSLVPPAVTPDEPAHRARRRPAGPAHREWQGGNTGTLAAVPGHDLARHGDRLGRRGAGQRRRDPRRLARRAGAERPAAGRDHVLRLGDRDRDARSSSGAAVINMSYGSTRRSATRSTSRCSSRSRAGSCPWPRPATSSTDGNPLEFPASLPHVLTVAAVGRDLQPSYFSNANAAIDLSAPGEGIMTAVPPAHDGDGVADGYERQSGTSFSAPMVAAAVAWVRAARPDSDGRPGRPGRAALGSATSAARAGSPTAASASCRSAAR